MKGRGGVIGRVWLEGLCLGSGNWRGVLEEVDPL